MSCAKNTLHTFARVFLVIISCVLATFPATIDAQVKSGVADETKTIILQIANELSVEASSLDSTIETSEIDRLREAVMDAAYGGTEQLRPLLDNYLKVSQEQNSQENIDIANIINIFASRNGSSSQLQANENLKLQAYFDSEYWFVAHRAKLLETLDLLHNLEFNDALEKAQDALASIPNEASPEALEASFETNRVISAIYFYLDNLDLAAKSTAQFIDQGRQSKRDIEAFSILNNFAYALLKWEETETALKVSKISWTLSVNSTRFNQIISHYRYGHALNQSRDFQSASTVLSDGLQLSPTGSWKLNLQSQLAIAQAGAGETQAAIKTLKQIETAAQSDPKYLQRYGARLREARALLAANDNNPMEVFRLMQENQIEVTQKLLRNNSDDTQKLMGTLSNAKELQRAKEKELNLQNTLKQERIDAQERDAVKMKIIIALLAITAAGIGIFALQQRRVSAREIVLRKQADIGEKAKRDFLAVMSHELRTPLNGIIGLSEILSREGPTEDVKFKNGVIYKSGLSLLDLLTNILDMSKMEGGKVEIERAPTDIRDLVNTLGELWMTKAKAQDIDFLINITPDVPDRLMVDALRLRQCLENLMSNAIKFTKTGHVKIHVNYVADRRKTEKSVLSFVVTDTGSGMSPEKASEVFKPFTQADVSITREFGGSGLGLAITHSLAQLMGGKTSVESVLGEGSEFTLTVTAADPTRIKKQSDLTSAVSLRPTIKENIMAAEAKFNASTEPQLPKLPTEEPQTPKPSEPLPLTHSQQSMDTEQVETVARSQEPHAYTPAPNLALTALVPPPFPSAGSPVAPKPISQALSADIFKDVKVLVVEDIASNRDVLKIFLSPVGCQVSVAVNGREALETLSSERFDIVLMDVRMPIMDGIEATQALRASAGPNRNVAVIALTADASPMSNAKCMAAGADVFLTKPVVADELFGAMRFVLTQAKLRQAKSETPKTPFPPSINVA